MPLIEKGFQSPAHGLKTSRMPPIHKFFVFQIVYDEVSEALRDPGFLPLDNLANPRPDWYEFWPIRKFLLENPLDDEAWYGFLSPKFMLKTGLSAEDVYRFLAFSEGKADVALIGYEWAQLAYFRNPFEQGEYWHPGILGLSQQAFGRLGFDEPLQDTTYHSGNFAFCNFIIAKPRYWRIWLELADRLFALVEHGSGELGDRLRANTTYGPNSAPVKTFIQERLPFLIIRRNGFSTSNFPLPQSHVAHTLISPEEGDRAHKMLSRCDALKKQFVQTGDARLLEEFHATRSRVKLLHLR